jgi:quercetin dioxygenase-like cupin family protein
MLDVVKGKAVATLAADAGEVLDVFGASMVVKADPAELGFFLADHIVPPGYFVPPHIHAEEDEAFFILDGELTLLDAAGERRVGRGGTALLPRGAVHGFRNDTAAPVRFLVTLRPGLQGLEMFRHFSRAGRAVPGGLTPPEIVAICAQYGVRMG